MWTSRTACFFSVLWNKKKELAIRHASLQQLSRLNWSLNVLSKKYIFIKDTHQCKFFLYWLEKIAGCWTSYVIFNYIFCMKNFQSGLPLHIRSKKCPFFLYLHYLSFDCLYVWILLSAYKYTFRLPMVPQECIYL